MSGRTDFSKYLTLFDILTLRNSYLLRMTVHCPIAVAVVYDTIVAVASAAAAGIILSIVVSTGIAYEDNCTCGGSADACSSYSGRPNIYSLMVGPPTPAYTV